MRRIHSSPPPAAQAAEAASSRSAELPLRDAARHLRRNLIALSVGICLLVSGTLYLGSESFLGLRLDPGDRGMLDYLLLGLLGYWALSFLCYAAIDLLSWGSRGGPGGFLGILLSPVVLLLELVLPLGVATLATLVMLPEFVNEDSIPGFHESLTRIRDDRITEHATERNRHALERSALALDTRSAESILAEALVATRLDAEDLSTPALLAPQEAELASSLHAVHFDGLLSRAKLADYQSDFPGAIAYLQEAAFFLLNDDIADEEQADLLATLDAGVTELEERIATIEREAAEAAAAEAAAAEAAAAEAAIAGAAVDAEPRQ